MVIKISLNGKVTFQQRLERSEGVTLAYLGKELQQGLGRWHAMPMHVPGTASLPAPLQQREQGSHCRV